MSNIIHSANQQVEVVREGRTYQLTIFTPKNKEYWFKLDHEIVESHDGVVKYSEVDVEKSPIIKTMSSVLNRQDSFQYTDLNGISHNIPSKDLPLIVSAFCDVLRSEISN